MIECPRDCAPTARSSTSASSARPVSSPNSSSSRPPTIRAGKPVSAARRRVRVRRAPGRRTEACAGAPARAALPRGTLGRAHGHPLRRDPLRESHTRGVVRQREHRACVSLRDLATREHPEHLLRQVEQPDAVRDRRPSSGRPGPQRHRGRARTRRSATRTRGPPPLQTGSRGPHSRRDRGEARHGRRQRERRRAVSARQPRGQHASGARPPRAGSRPRVSAGRRRAAARPGDESMRPGRRSPPARSDAAAGVDSDGSPRPASAAARAARLRRSEPRGRDPGRGGGCR